MNKRNIIILVILVLLVLGVVGYFVFGRGTTTPDPNASPTPDASSMPLASDNPVFSPTPTGTVDMAINVCPSAWTGTDSDGDGLPDNIEAIYKTDPANPDSDSDGYKDGDEVRNGYDPMSPGNVRLDSDNDGLFDNEECTTWKTNPLNPDTDNDGHKDGEEVKNGYDPLRPGSVKIGDPTTTPPTPTPTGGLTFGTPTPTPTTLPTNAPTTQPTTSTSLELVKRSELKISASTGSTAVKTYLTAVDNANPKDLISNPQFSIALTSAFKGDTSKLRVIIAGLKQHEQQIIAVSTPEVAVTHQTLFVSLVRFVNNQLTIIADAAGKNTNQQYEAALDIQRKLSANLTLLGAERQKLETLAK